ncbi:hypothetical protein CRG98_004917, partial [Punica granatum]
PRRDGSSGSGLKAGEWRGEPAATRDGKYRAGALAVPLAQIDQGRLRDHARVSIGCVEMAAACHGVGWVFVEKESELRRRRRPNRIRKQSCGQRKQSSRVGTRRDGLPLVNY